MCNELGITRNDIEKWTKEAVATETNKKLEQLNIPGIVRDKVSEAVRASLGSSYNSTALSKDIASELAKSLKVVPV